VRKLIGGEQAFVQGDAGADQRYRAGQIGPWNLRAAGMIFCPLSGSVGLKATASSRVATLPVFVASRPSRTR
jgi:hypothetical protein